MQFFLPIEKNTMEYIKNEDLIQLIPETKIAHDSILLILDNSKAPKKSELGTVSLDILKMMLLNEDKKVMEISLPEKQILVYSVKHTDQMVGIALLTCQIMLTQQTYKGKKFYPKQVRMYEQTATNKKVYKQLLEMSNINAKLREELFA